MDVDINNAFGQDSQQSKPVEDMEGFLGERRKIIQPGSLKDPKLEDLKTRLTDWINTTLKPEHIVVQSLEEDLFDGLVLHHLLVRLAGMKLDVEEIALTAMAQKRKLGVILEAINRVLGLSKEDSQKWSVNLIHNRDLLSTLHLLVAIVKHFQPEMALPSNVCLEVIILEVSKAGIKSEKITENITEPSSGSLDENSHNPIDELLKLEPQKVNTVKQAILHFVNKNMARMGLQVSDIDTQFSDGVILLLLIGQLEDYFVHLSEFYLTPSTNEEMVHNVTLALDLLSDRELQLYNVAPEDIVSQDLTATLTVLYALFKKYKYR
ncbi:gamma-parvin isoform X1 [Lepisosteus oculatus]|uniref:gamma-parvin isoform X1 n=1 Tax=Lepisosteus oculatus TaxID=7918 RepID=UPI0037178C8E